MLAEIERWTAEKIISPGQSRELRTRYEGQLTLSSPPWGIILFSSAGAVVGALGVILLLAYNWHAIPKFGKLALVFAGLAGAHLSSRSWRPRLGWQSSIGEALSLAGTLLFGAGIWLIAQIYNISGHYPDGFMIWAFAAIALAWATDSVPQAVLGTVLLSIWGCAESWHYDNSSLAALLILFAAILPLAWRLRSTLLLATFLGAVYTLALSNVYDYGNGHQVFRFTFAFSALLVAVSRLLRAGRPDRQAFASLGYAFGFTWFLGCIYALSFREGTAQLADWSNSAEANPTAAFALIWAVFALALVAWFARIWQATRLRHEPMLLEEWLCPIAVIYVYLTNFAAGYAGAGSIAFVFNLVLLGISLMWMLRGCRTARLGPTVRGSLLLALLVLSRYFDLFESIAARGLVFLILGAILFAEALYFHRSRQALARGDSAP